MELIYSGLGIIDEDGVKKKIEECEKKASPFQISCFENAGAWGIWLTIGEDSLLVNPIELVNSLFIDGEQFDFFLPFGEKKMGRFTLSTRREAYHINTELGHMALSSSSQQRYMFDEYVSKCQQTIADLLRVAEEGKTLAYESRDVSVEAIRMCAKQMDIKAVLPSYYRLRSQDVVVEPFFFEPLNDQWRENYKIAIGERGYNTWLTHYDNNVEAIRHELESYVFEQEAVIKLSFDLSYTIIKLKKVRAIEDIKKVGPGIGFEYKHYIEVQIEPNEFVHMPVIKGLCDEKAMIRSLYEGLLRWATLHPETSKDDEVPSRMVMYNKLKSPIIESFLRDEHTKDDEYAIRQVHVKDLLRIDPDFDVVIWDSEDIPLFVDTGDIIDRIYDKQGKPIALPGLDSWQSEMRSIVIDAATGHSYEKDWQDYHKRGLELARRLRSMLSSDFDLWYEPPFEDKSGTMPRWTLII